MINIKSGVKHQTVWRLALDIIQIIWNYPTQKATFGRQCMHGMIWICTDQKCINRFPLTTNLQPTTLKTTEQKYEQPIEIEFKLLSRSDRLILRHF